MYLVLFVILLVRWFLADTDRWAQCLRFDLLSVIWRRSACEYHMLERCRLSLFFFFLFFFLIWVAKFLARFLMTPYKGLVHADFEFQLMPIDLF